MSGVFGGKTCSQLVCSSCGYAKNRFEDFYNLSLPVQDKKSMAESLEKMIEGEKISDF
jgi:ubiquitin carboxyl-terminal hydrolase 34